LLVRETEGGLTGHERRGLLTWVAYQDPCIGHELLSRRLRGVAVENANLIQLQASDILAEHVQGTELILGERLEG